MSVERPPQDLKPALTVKEFAEYFGRSKRWGYDIVYRGEVRVLRKSGVTMIPRSEVLRFLGEVEEYSGRRPSNQSPDGGES